MYCIAQSSTVPHGDFNADLICFRKRRLFSRWLNSYYCRSRSYKLHHLAIDPTLEPKARQRLVAYRSTGTMKAALAAASAVRLQTANAGPRCASQRRSLPLKTTQVRRSRHADRHIHAWRVLWCSSMRCTRCRQTPRWGSMRRFCTYHAGSSMCEGSDARGVRLITIQCE